MEPIFIFIGIIAFIILVGFITVFVLVILRICKGPSWDNAYARRIPLPAWARNYHNRNVYNQNPGTNVFNDTTVPLTNQTSSYNPNYPPSSNYNPNYPPSSNYNQNYPPSSNYNPNYPPPTGYTPNDGPPPSYNSSNAGKNPTMGFVDIKPSSGAN